MNSLPYRQKKILGGSRFFGDKLTRSLGSWLVRIRSPVKSWKNRRVIDREALLVGYAPSAVPSA